ncbi:MAG: hypothetical protein M1819_004550 [Sarea resinae]|nr:MAG: hypothetical protein M1819_004550 [Sarea resinae]
MSPQTSIFHRSLSKAYPPATGGKGVYLHTADGRRVLDGCSGAAVSCLGHGHAEVIEAIVAQAQTMAYAHTAFFTSTAAERLADLLLDQSHGAFAKVMFLSSGAEAVESAIKIARQFHLSRAEDARVNVIGRVSSYHGNTLGALAAGFHPDRRAPYEPMLSKTFHHVSPCFYSRDGGHGANEAEYEDRLLEEFREKIQELGPHTVAAIIVEPVVGMSLGCVPATRNYLPRLKSLCEEFGILLIFDEVMCGMGRVGTFHAWQSLGGVAPHLQANAKGLGGGYQPISAVLVSEEVHAEILKASETSPFVHGQTYQGHSIGCAAALATQTVIKRDGLLENVVKRGQLLVSSIRNGLPKEVEIEIRGLGLFQAVSFGKTGAEYSGGALAEDVSGECFKRGVAVLVCSSVVDAFMVAPPFIISEAEVLELANTIVVSIDAVLRRRRL